MARWLVDGMNVIGSRPDGWWRDRDGAVRRLVERLRLLAAEADDVTGVTLVLDGRPLPDLPEGEHAGVAVRYGRRGGRNAADDRIVALVTDDPEPGTLSVVSSDRDLGRRARALGATVVPAGELLRRLDLLCSPECGGGRPR